MQNLNKIADDIRCLLQPTPEFEKQKLEDFRFFSVVMFFAAAAIVSLLWIWDYVTDPVGAMETIGHRIRYLFLSIVAIFFIFCKRYIVLASLVLIGYTLSIVNYIAILKHLDGGMIHGLAGFMYVMIFALLTFQSFSFRFALFGIFWGELFLHL
jgi:hypothetical protein